MMNHEENSRKDRESRVTTKRVREEAYTTSDVATEQIKVEERDEEEYCYHDDRVSSPPLSQCHRYFGESDSNSSEEIIETNTVYETSRSYETRSCSREGVSGGSVAHGGCRIVRNVTSPEREKIPTIRQYFDHNHNGIVDSSRLKNQRSRETAESTHRNGWAKTGHRREDRLATSKPFNMAEEVYSADRYRNSTADSEGDYGTLNKYVDTASLMAADGQSRSKNIRVHQQGDTTVITEHRDPYSFYWQLDQVRKHNGDPPRSQLRMDYVMDEEEVAENVLSPDSHDSGINVENQYSRPMRSVESPVMETLPSGWEKHKDPSGYSYYWHIDSGTIQREPPVRVSPPLQFAHSSYTNQQPVIEEHAYRQTKTERHIGIDYNADDGDTGKSVRFAVRSLGWTEIAEEDLTPEKSSRAVNKAIVDLSTGKNDILDNVSKWGDGRELIMEIDDIDLTLIDPDTMATVHSEPIQQIRVWGVGRDNGRDFAYVARDQNSRTFMCHVFRCDTPARTIANTLRDICKKLMLQRRPNTLHSSEQRQGKRIIARDSMLPTPIEETKKVIRCHFLGVTQVPRATGMEILNEAVDRLLAQVRQDRWISADVSIAPSTITITEVNGNQIAQCRVRYLSFLGVGRDVKHCAFIMHTSSKNYMCYVFHVEPSAGPMAKTIEAACKLRYQKVLDAHTNVHTSSGGREESVY